MKQFEQHKALKSENLIVGLENPDDGGVINVGETKIIQTVDFFTPILDNPYDWEELQQRMLYQTFMQWEESLYLHSN